MIVLKHLAIIFSKMNGRTRFLLKTFLSISFFNIFLQTACMAQETIIPELSSNYVEKLISIAKENYPKVKSYQNHINIAKNTIAKTNVSLFDAVTVSYVYQPGQATIDPVNPTTSYFKGLQAGVFLNLGTILSKPYVVHQAKQELLIAQNDQAEYLLNIATEVKKRYFTYQLRIAELKLQIKATQDAEASLNDIRYRFEKGEETFDGYNKIQNDLTNHKMSKLQAEANLFMAKTDLEEMLGVPLENVK
jgi:outer membrane protein TolC